MQNEKCKLKMEKEKNELSERLLDYKFSLFIDVCGNR